MKFARIDLSQTNYKLFDHAQIVPDPPVAELQQIYQQYCRYKQFSSVMPLFASHFTSEPNSTIVYQDAGQIVAFSIMRQLDQHNMESVQFAWNYHNPELRLGIRSLEHECALYKSLGYHYLYVGEAQHYKSQFDGYETLGTI